MSNTPRKRVTAGKMDPDPPATITGSCHCGNLSFEFATSVAPEGMTIRECQCRFCRVHGAATARDPGGSVRIRAADPDRITLYRFGTNSTDFMLCGRCGVYLGAIISNQGKRYATLNMRLTSVDLHRARPIVHDDETAADRIARRVRTFTPVLEYPF